MSDQQAPKNFTLRDWDQQQYDWVAPRDRFIIYDGPAVGGVESNWQPKWGVLIDLPQTGGGDGLDLSIHEATQLRDSLTTVLEQLDQ